MNENTQEAIRRSLLSANEENNAEMREAKAASKAFAEANFVEDAVMLITGLGDAPEARKRLILVSSLDFARTNPEAPNARINELINHFKDTMYSMSPIESDEHYQEAAAIVAEFGEGDETVPLLISIDADMTEQEEKRAAEEIAKIEAAVAKMKANEEAAAMKAEEDEKKKKENTNAARRAAFEKRFGPGKSGGRRTRKASSRKASSRKASSRKASSRKASSRKSYRKTRKY
jgi:hypothetical protein